MCYALKYSRLWWKVNFFKTNKHLFSPPLLPPKKTTLAVALRDIFLKCQLHDYTLFTLIFILEILSVNDSGIGPWYHGVAVRWMHSIWVCLLIFYDDDFFDDDFYMMILWVIDIMHEYCEFVCGRTILPYIFHTPLSIEGCICWKVLSML